MSTASSPSPSMSFKRTSLLLCSSAGGAGSGINQKIDAAVSLAREYNLSVLADGPAPNLPKCGTADIVIIRDVTSTFDLNFLVNYYLGAAHHPSARQFIIGTSLTLSELEPAKQMLTDRKFDVVANGSNSADSLDDSSISVWVAEHFLVPATATAATSTTASSTSSTSSIGSSSVPSAHLVKPTTLVLPLLTSLILMGKNEKSISKEINELVGNTADLGTHLPITFVDASSHSNPLASDNVDNVGIVVCTNVAKLKDLHRLIRDYSTCRQFLIATTLMESEVRPLDCGGLHKFEYFNCSTSSFSSFQDDVVPEMIKEWKAYAAATKSSSTPSTSSTSSAPTATVESKDEADASTASTAPVPVEPVRRFNNEHSLILAGPDGCGKSSKLKHLTSLAKESRLEVKTVDASAFEFGKLLSPEVIVCNNIDTVDLLQHAITCAKRTQTQLLLGTSLTEEQLLPFKDELLNLGCEVYFFEAISAEERAESAAVIAAGGIAPTISLDWAIEWAGCDTSSCCVERLQAARKAKGQSPY